MKKSFSHPLPEAWDEAFRRRFHWYAKPVLEHESETAVTPALLRKYPALLQLHHRQRKNYAAFAGDFARHLARFSFAGHAQLPVRHIQFDRSDPHHGGRTVLEVHFADGARWFYKPRSGHSEAGWFRLLEWVNACRFAKAFKTVPLVTDRNHSWMRAVAAKPVRNASEASAYYFRAGAVIYLADMLRAVDLHAANLIAHGAQPVLIDAETFWHARTRLPSAVRGQAPGILRTGLLPLDSNVAPEKEVSAFGRLIPGPHLLQINDVAATASTFIQNFAAGFTAMHELWLREAPSRAFLETTFFGARKHLTRRLYRPTSMYVAILRRSLQPPLLRDASKRHRFLQSACADRLVPRSCFANEVAALADGDIPLFYGRASAAQPTPSARALGRSLADLRSALTPPKATSYNARCPSSSW